LQIALDGSGAGRGIAEFVVPVLGVWHVYKQLSNVLWRRFSSSFLGPMFHMLHPGAYFKATPKLATITRFFTMLRLVTPDLLPAIDAALASTAASGYLASNSHLSNFRDLLTKYLPQVFFVMNLILH
jgi:hypothetical protein